jgi:NitT/TauT family transport system substrate-binding protein
MKRRTALVLAVALAASLVSIAPTTAQETLKLAVGARGNWDTVVPEIGQRAGIFKKHGLTLDLLYTQGGGETLQAVISGSVDIGIAAGTPAVMSAFIKGAPVRILLAGVTGSSDLYWYVPASSPIKSFKDADGKTAGYSTVGASTHTTLLKLIKHYDSKARPVGSGASPVTYTQAMSGQIDIGWASPPFGLQPLAEGKIRIIARGSDVPTTRDQTVRVHIVNANTLASRGDAVKKFVAAYRETWEWLYSNPDALAHFSEISGVSQALAGQIRDEFLPKTAMSPDVVSGLNTLMDEAVAFKVIQQPLTDEQLSGLIQGPQWKR